MLPGKIEEVGVPLLEYFLEEVKDVFVFLYDEDDVRSMKLLKGLEEVTLYHICSFFICITFLPYIVPLSITLTFKD